MNQYLIALKCWILRLSVFFRRRCTLLLRKLKISPKKVATKRKKLVKTSDLRRTEETTTSTDLVVYGSETPSRVVVDRSPIRNPETTNQQENVSAADDVVFDDDDEPFVVRVKRRNLQAQIQHVRKEQARASTSKEPEMPSNNKKDKGKSKLWTREDFEDDDENKSKVRRKNATEEFPAIKQRSGLGIFVKAIAHMNDSQRKAVEKLVFGSLLKLQDIGVPKLICYWLVEHYNPRRGKILFPDGQYIDVLEKDVDICLGFPRGTIEVIKHGSLVNTPVLAQWREHIGKTMHLIRYGDVAASMLNAHEGDDVFVRDFIILLHSSIIEPEQSGAVNQTLVRSLEDVHEVGKWNWCSFVINCLVDAKKKWDANKKGSFTGPLLFLTVLYLDRVVLYNKRPIPRSIPTFVGWNMESVTLRELEEIEYGKIGDGNVVARQSLLRTSTKEDSASQGINQTLSEDLRTMAKAILSFSEHMRAIPEGGMEDEITKAIIETGKALLGSVTDAFQQSEGVPVLSQVGKVGSQSQDPFWSHPDLIKMVEEVESAMAVREQLIKREEDSNGPQNMHGFARFDDQGPAVFDMGNNLNDDINLGEKEDMVSVPPHQSPIPSKDLHWVPKAHSDVRAQGSAKETSIPTASVNKPSPPTAPVHIPAQNTAAVHMPISIKESA